MTIVLWWRATPSPFAGYCPIEGLLMCFSVYMLRREERAHARSHTHTHTHTQRERQSQVDHNGLFIFFLSSVPPCLLALHPSLSFSLCRLLPVCRRAAHMLISSKRKRRERRQTQKAKEEDECERENTKLRTPLLAVEFFLFFFLSRSGVGDCVLVLRPRHPSLLPTRRGNRVRW